MQLLIVVSTELELSAFADHIPLRRKEFGFDLQTPAGQVDILVSGVGIPSTIYQLMRFLQKDKPELVLQVGFAGSFSRALKPGDLVEVHQDCFGDLGLDNTGRFTPLHEAFPDLPGSSGWMQYEQRTDLPAKKGITVNTTSGSREREDLMLKTWQPEVETMEGAAAMWVCEREAIPFFQVRCVSNYTGNRDQAAWNVVLAQQKISNWLINYLKLS